MSGFEALGMASGVLQVIAFAASTANLCKAVYDGASTADEEIRQNALSMRNAADNMRTYSRGMAPSPSFGALLDIVDKCYTTAEKLQSEVDSIKTLQGKGDLFRSARVALKSMRKKSTIEKLQRALGDYQTTMETHILLHIWLVLRYRVYLTLRD